jgi:hypothetical protein
MLSYWLGKSEFEIVVILLTMKLWKDEEMMILMLQG